MSEPTLRRASIPSRDRKAHKAWLERGRTGPGRLHLEERRIIRPQLGAWVLTASRWVRCELHQGFAAAISLGEAEFERCKWIAPNLLMADLDRATLVDTVFLDARMATCTARGITVRGGALCEAQLQKANWSAAVLTNVDFQGALMNGIDLQDSRIEDCSFRGADLSDARLSGTRFVRCDLTNARLPDNADCVDCTR